MKPNEFWKIPLRLLVLALCLAGCRTNAATVFPPPTNPAPVICLCWMPLAPTANISNYFIYYGVASGVYTNQTSVGNVTNFNVTLPARGIPFYFVLSAVSSNGLQSGFSNEITNTPPLPPPAPGMLPPVILVVQSKANAPGSLWAAAGMNWTLEPTQANQMFRLQIAQAGPPPPAPPAPPAPAKAKAKS